MCNWLGRHRRYRPIQRQLWPRRAKDRELRLSETLLLGHGAALLVIFNARASGSVLDVASQIALRDVAWFFGAGLVAAFVVALVEIHSDGGMPENNTAAALDRFDRDRNARGCWATLGLLGSATLFAIGLIAEINAIAEVTASG
ncbi:MAG TPA: hypothetical protein DHW63_02710 [Hyphomonadaceae bacterium]|nr:hypothetical protein [Hyphomonadaceae bacterium]